MPMLYSFIVKDLPGQYSNQQTVCQHKMVGFPGDFELSSVIFASSTLCFTLQYMQTLELCI